MKYFIPTSDPVQLRQQYLSLAKVHHPDVGGDTSVMQEINNEYEEATRSPGMNQDEMERAAQVAKDFIRQFMMMHPWQRMIVIATIGLQVLSIINTSRIEPREDR